MKDQAGGSMREPMSTTWAGASATKAQMVSWVMTWKVHETKASASTQAMKTMASWPGVRLRQRGALIGCAA